MYHALICITKSQASVARWRGILWRSVLLCVALRCVVMLSGPCKVHGRIPHSNLRRAVLLEYSTQTCIQKGGVRCFEQKNNFATFATVSV